MTGKRLWHFSTTVIAAFAIIASGCQVASATILFENFKNSNALSGDGGFGAVRSGSFTHAGSDQRFKEQTATGFTLDQISMVTGFELVLFQFSGNVDSFDAVLTRGSTTNPGAYGGFPAPDLQNVIERWHFEDQLPPLTGNRSIFSVQSVLRPVLQPGELYWLTLVAGREVLSGETIDIGWWSGDIVPTAPFARRNNIFLKPEDEWFGPIEDTLWVTPGDNPSNGYTLRVLGEQVPEPSTLLLFALPLLSLLGFSLMRRREPTIAS